MLDVAVHSEYSLCIAVTGSTAGVVHLPMRMGEIPSRICATGQGWERLSWRPKLDWDEVADAIRSYKGR